MNVFRWIGVCALAASTLGLNAGEMLWKGEKLSEWSNQPRRCSVAVQNGNLLVSNIGKDSGLNSPVLALDPKAFDTLRFRYRAQGTGEKAGQLYFRHAGDELGGARVFNVYPLKNDGAWYDSEIDFTKLRDRSEWLDKGAITAMRLDLTDSEGGTVEISEIRLYQKAAPVKVPQEVKAKVHTGEPVWSGAALAEWTTKPLHCEAAVKNGNLVLSNIGGDAGVNSPALALDPEKYNAFRFRYRAVNLGERNGQFYFRHADDAFSQNRLFNLVHLQKDGAWHVFEGDATQLADPSEWLAKGPITALRLDPTDSAGGTFEISEIRFFYKKMKMPEKGLPKTAWQLDEGKWPKVKNEIWPDFPPKKIKGVYFIGKMIKCPEDLPAQKTPRDYCLRREINLKAAPAEAWAQFCADNFATLYLNGQEIAKNHIWYEPTLVEVTRALHAGKNAWCFSYNNYASPGGVIAELFVRYADGQIERFATDGEFRSTVNPGKNWNQTMANSADWKPVTVQEPGPNSPWLQELIYQDPAYRQQVKSAECSVKAPKAGEKARLVYRFAGEVPPTPFYVNVSLVDNRFDYAFWTDTIEVKASDVSKRGNGEWELNFEYTFPLYMNSYPDMTIRLRSHAFCLENHDVNIASTLTRLANVPGYEKPVTAQVKTGSYGPYVELNGKPFYVMWGSFGQSQTRRYDGSFRISDGPLNVLTLFPQNHSRFWWVDEDIYNFSEYDRMAEFYRRDNPDAWFVADISLYPPFKWCDRYLDEMVRDEKGDFVNDAWPSRHSYSPSGKHVRKGLMDAALAALDYLEHSPYANRIIGYRINGGHTMEWLGWHTAGKEKLAMDFSKASQEGFAEYLAENFPQVKDRTVPSGKERWNTENEDILWNPQNHLKAIAYNQYMSESMVAMFAPIWRAVKQKLGGKKLQGGYYGYTATLFVYGSEQWRAHFALEKMFKDCEPDFIICPIPYDIRGIGDPIGDMKPFTTMNDHKIITIMEDDVRTSNQPLGNFWERITYADTLGTIRRDMASVMCRNQPCYYFAITSGYEFDSPEMARDVASEKVVGEHCLAKQTKRNAEIAIVFSEKSVTGMPIMSQSSVTGIRQQYKFNGEPEIVNNVSVAPTTELFRHDTARILRAGAPVDFLLAEDLKNHEHDYKLYIFANCFTVDEALIQAVERLRQKGCTMLWLYAPGYTANFRNSVETMERLSGIPFRRADGKLMPAVKMADGRWMGTTTLRLTPMFEVTPAPGVMPLATYENGKIGMAMRKVGKSTMIFSGAYQLDMPFIQQLVKDAGVHVYSTTTDPVDANESLIMLHARFDGEKTLKLPQKTDVIDIFNRQLVGKNIDEISFQAPLHTTHFFYYGSDAETVLKKLQALPEK